MHVLNIKNMVCPRCIKVVREEMEKLGFRVLSIKLGEVVLDAEPGHTQLEQIKEALEKNGFELLSDQKSKLIAQIKTEIINRIHYREDEPAAGKLTTWISRSLGRDYSYLSKLFSNVEGISIERFLILQKIEKAKELLIYDEWSVSQIAYQLGYSSSQHLSAQFKSVTGMTPSQFKRSAERRRKPLDDVKG